MRDKKKTILKPLRVLSLFDGISCGQVALERAGIPIETYYASEIDKYAISITQYNYPNTIQLGDVEKINFKQFEGKIDLLIGGSPCTNLSMNGNRKGLEGEESRLFWEYARAIKECNPKYFLLENVESMSEKDEEIISKELGCYPCMINSSLVSAQNRRRYYWTNIKLEKFGLFNEKRSSIPQPKDKNIILSDILLSGIGIGVERKGQIISCVQTKADCLLARNYKGFGNQRMTAVLDASDKQTPYEIKDGKLKLDYKILNINLPNGYYKVRKLTPLEYERLQTLSDEYTQFGKDGDNIIKISNMQRYKAIGNGWTVDVIAHIFDYLKD